MRVASSPPRHVLAWLYRSHGRLDFRLAGPDLCIVVVDLRGSAELGKQTHGHFRRRRRDGSPGCQAHCVAQHLRRLGV